MFLKLNLEFLLEPFALKAIKTKYHLIIYLHQTE